MIVETKKCSRVAGSGLLVPSMGCATWSSCISSVFFFFWEKNGYAGPPAKKKDYTSSNQHKLACTNMEFILTYAGHFSREDFFFPSWS